MSLDYAWVSVPSLYFFSFRVCLIYAITQAVVVSIDPRRVYVKDPSDVEFKTVRLTNPGKESD